MTGLPKAYIRKYGVTKKAWSAFRSHALAKKSRVEHRRVIGMARRRRYARRLGGRAIRYRGVGGRKAGWMGMLASLGLGVVAGQGTAQVLSRVGFGQFAPIAGLVASYAVGGMPGLAGNFLVTGGLNLGGLFGGAPMTGAATRGAASF
jgi:hypothetical protein